MGDILGGIGDGVTSLLGGVLAPQVLGSSGKNGSLPATPDYKGAALAEANAGKYNETTPYGSVGWTMRPGADPNNPQPGDYIRSTTLNQGQQGLYNQRVGNQSAIGGALGGQIGQLGNARSAADALYGKTTRYYGQQFGDSENALRAQLQNQGLTEGSEAYDKALRNFNQTKNEAYGTAADNAVIGADSMQNNLVSRIAQLLASTNNQSPVSSNVSAAPALTNAANLQGQADISANNASRAQAAQSQQNLGTMASALMMAFSDRRLKSDIELLGRTPAGLNFYEYTIFGKRERGYMAQEVLLHTPEAVHEHSSGYLQVDYDRLGGRP